VIGDGLDSEHKGPKGWQRGSDKLSTQPEPDPTDGAEQGSSAAGPERLTSTAKPSTREIERSPTKNTTSLYQAPRLHRLVQSTKQWLIGVQHKLASRGASRKAKKEARELEKMRSLLLIDFWPAEQADQAQSKVADKVDRPAGEPRRPPESQARVRPEQERQQTEIEQARLRAEEETPRAEEERRLAEAQARIRAEQERQAEAEREQ
jgi:hypothetical protein